MKLENDQAMAIPNDRKKFERKAPIEPDVGLQIGNGKSAEECARDKRLAQLSYRKALDDCISDQPIIQTRKPL